MPVDGISDDIARADDHARAQRHARPDGSDATTCAGTIVQAELSSDARPQWLARAKADVRAIADAVRSAYTGPDAGTNGKTDRSSDDEARHHPSDGWLHLLALHPASPVPRSTGTPPRGSVISFRAYPC